MEAFKLQLEIYGAQSVPVQKAISDDDFWYWRLYGPAAGGFWSAGFHYGCGSAPVP